LVGQAPCAKVHANNEGNEGHYHAVISFST
jgi:hypothetical protein